MATIENQETIDLLLASNGHYTDDPPVMAMIEYETAEGRTAIAVMYQADPIDRYAESR